MKIKLALFNAALILYFVGLLCAIGISMGTGAIVVIVASVIMLGLYIAELYQAVQAKTFFSLEVLSYTMGALAITEIFLLGFSIAIDRSLFAAPGFFQFHVFVGFILLILFARYSIREAKKSDDKNLRTLLLAGISVSGLLSLLGFLSFAGFLPASPRLIYFGFVFLTFFYAAYFLLARFISKQKVMPETFAGLLLSGLLIMLWIFRWQIPELISPGIYRVILHMGFTIIIILPLAILLIKRIHFLTIFILYTTILDFYFISFDKEFKYLVNVGTHECIGYEKATDYPVVRDPGIAIEELFKAPTREELSDILNEWDQKDFTPKQIKVEHVEQMPNGDSVKVISHDVNGQKHYGLIRIPAGLNENSAPILLSLAGGGAELDVLEENSLNRISGGACRDVLNKFITVCPSFRGDLLKGKDFCFRSEGYTGDVWLGAAEDAVSFLRVVKTMYGKSDSTKVLAMGVSRGATVALIIGALTKQTDYIIAISTHTNFLNLEAFKNERVGSDYSKIFFTPQTTPENIRKRIIASSPYYFAERLPRFEIHQGTTDILTTVSHTKQLAQRLHDLGRSDSTYHIYYYENKGHGYDDDNVVCKSLQEFAE
jgi:hypothetical protein